MVTFYGNYFLYNQNILDIKPSTLIEVLNVSTRVALKSARVLRIHPVSPLVKIKYNNGSVKMCSLPLG